MGSSAKHGSKTTPRLRGIMIASTLAITVIATTAWALVSTGGSKARSTAAGAELTGRTPGRAARDSVRTPLPDPSAAGTASAAPEPVSKGARPARKVSRKARHRLRVLSSGVCQASYYGGSQATASGEPFNPNALTAAHKTLPMDSRVRVTNEATGRSVIVRINDRGPYVGGRCLDLSTAAMKAVGGVGSGVITAKYQVLARA